MMGRVISNRKASACMFLILFFSKKKYMYKKRREKVEKGKGKRVIEGVQLVHLRKLSNALTRLHTPYLVSARVVTLRLGLASDCGRYERVPTLTRTHKTPSLARAVQRFCRGSLAPSGSRHQKNVPHSGAAKSWRAHQSRAQSRLLRRDLQKGSLLLLQSSHQTAPANLDVLCRRLLRLQCSRAPPPPLGWATTSTMLIHATLLCCVLSFFYARALSFLFLFLPLSISSCLGLEFQTRQEHCLRSKSVQSVDRPGLRCCLQRDECKRTEGREDGV